MCGICGFVGKADRSTVWPMLARIEHRGPDDHGVYESPQGPAGTRAVLGHRRLAIIDLSPAGHQPMSDAAGKLWLTYNGEIYNYRQLRDELRGLGHEFVSGSDTEVVIAAYRQWGTECLSRFVGMFAFAIWDEDRRALFAARDRLGEKPFYWTMMKDGFAFASEIKAFLDLPGFERAIDVEGLNQYLTFLWTPDPMTVFKGVHKLPPGHFLIYREGDDHPLIEEYWDLEFRVEHGVSEREWQDRIYSALDRAVDRQMISDVPLGAFLSGGVDSSMIVGMMSNRSDRQVQTYTVGFREDDLRYDVQEDDVAYARDVAKRFDTNSHVRILEPDVMDLLPKLVYSMDEPTSDPALITSYLICKEARATLTVLLSGVGGDELFAGYPRTKAMRLAGYYNALPRPLVQTVVDMLPASRPGPFNAPLRNLKKLSKSSALPWEERYLGFGTYFTDQEKARLYTAELREQTAGMDAYAYHRRHLRRVRDQLPLNQLLYLDIKTFLPCLNLTYTDKTAMAASVEGRAPFLDHELVELAARVPPDLKLKGLKSKYVLKKAAERLLPPEVVWRKKAGFRAPVRAWLANDLKPMVEDLLSRERIERRGLFDYAEVRRIVDDNLAHKEDNALKVFQLLTLELWFDTFITS